MTAQTKKKVLNGPFAAVALPLPVRQTFTYSIPESLTDKAIPGVRTKVFFGNRSLIGYIVGVEKELPTDLGIDPAKIRPLNSILDVEALITSEILKLTEWAANYYVSFWGEMLRASVPAGLSNNTVKPKRRKAVRLLPPPLDDKKPLTAVQQIVIETLHLHRGQMLFTELLEKADIAASPVNTLSKRGYVEVFVEDVLRDPLKNSVSVKENADQLSLTQDQSNALNAMTDAISASEFTPFLLHGVTGSGKTEVYIRAMKFALERGLSAMMLVPEIALTPVFSRRLREVFGRDVAILHSNLSAGERFDEWRRLRSGEARIAIGTRSAVFAPLENIGLLIIDEEHDPSYRQHESPFYNARDVAVMRAKMADAVVVLGSATPSMESFYNAKTGKYRYLQMPVRIGGRALAEAELVDMRDVFRHAGKDVSLSPALIDALRKTQQKGEQSIVLMNRRGFSHFVLCRTCGESIKCKNCDITMTFHRSQNKLICHYCNYRINTPSICPLCESNFLYFVGQGTENLAEQLQKIFPKMRIARVDRDTIQRKGEIDQLLTRFANGDLDMLVGTQMIAKGHDFPNVTLVGVVGIDIGLGLPDLRSAERTFQLITQVAGRAGRGDRTGKVLIQTYYPDNYALKAAADQDYEQFYNAEIRYRENFAYPPFYVLASIMVKHRDLATANKIANNIRSALDHVNRDRRVRIIGPAQGSISRIKDEFRVQMILRSTSRKELRRILDEGIKLSETSGTDLRRVFVEIDPIDLL